MTGSTATPHEQQQDQQQWQRLDQRTIRASAVKLGVATLATGIPTGIGLRIGDVSWTWTVIWLLGGTVAITAGTALIEWIRLRCSTFRIGDDRVEYTVTFLTTRRTSLPRDRIRTVEIVADPAHRLFGVADIRIGTGDQTGDLSLKSIDRSYAEQLRRQLIHRTGTETADGGPQIGELVRFRPSWIRFAPISFWTPVLGGAAFGAALQVANWFNVEGELLRRFQRLFDDMSLVAEIGIIAAGVLVVGAVANLAIYAESWWNYRLEREPDGSLRISHGLLNHRSTTFEEQRVRGVTVVQPVGIRLAGAARLDILATGLRKTDDDSKTSEPNTLMPAAPREQVLAVATAVLGTVMPGIPASGTATPDALTKHPIAARRRRYVRAAAAVVGVTAVLITLSLLVTPALWWVTAALFLPLLAFAVWSATDNYAGLGHAVTDRHLVLRSGSVDRRTEVLVRPGLLGWNLRQSPLQRRSGLATAFATTAAGRGALRLPDVGVDQAVDLLLATAPEWEHLRT